MLRKGVLRRFQNPFDAFSQQVTPCPIAGWV